MWPTGNVNLVETSLGNDEDLSLFGCSNRSNIKANTDTKKIRCVVFIYNKFIKQEVVSQVIDFII